MAVFNKVWRKLNRSHNFFSYVQTNMISRIFWRVISGTAISFIVCPQVKFMKRDRLERILHQVRDCATTLCSLDGDVALIPPWEVFNVWINLKIILCPSSEKNHGALFIFEGYWANLICVIAKLTLCILNWVRAVRTVALDVETANQITEVSIAFTRWQLFGYDLVYFIHFFNYNTFEKSKIWWYGVFRA